MNLDFYKLCTGKNDLILIDTRNQESPGVEILPRLARGLCLRKRGVGAHGVVFIFPGKEEVCKIRCFRPDGEETGLVNDALLLLGRYGFDSGLMSRRVLKVETQGGPRTIEAVDSSNFRINLGVPRTLNMDPIIPNPDADYTQVIPLEQRTVSMIPLLLHRRGAVFLDGGEYRGRRKAITAELKGKGPAQEPLHPVFVTLVNREEILIDSPLDKQNADHVTSCALGGTAGILSGFTGNEMIVRSRESRYYYEWPRHGEVYITGSADYTFSGTYYFEE